MSYEDGLIHSCTVYRKTEGPQDENGQPAITETSTNYKCRFYRKKIFRAPGILIVGANQHLVVPYSVFFPDNADIQKGDRVLTSIPGYAGTYNVFDVSPASGGSGTHHMQADIVRSEQ